MNHAHRILSACSAAAICLFLPMTTACSRSGEKESSLPPPTPEIIREGAPDLLPDALPDLSPPPGEEGVPYPYVPDPASGGETAGQPELTPPPARSPRPVRPAHPETSGGSAEKMPSPPARPKRGHRNSYRKDSDQEQDACSSDGSAGENCPTDSDSALPRPDRPRPMPRFAPRFKKPGSGN